jgi:hypothetical protein
VALDCVGGYLSRMVGNILFLDLVGTAIASLTYGPVHGALVGYISNFINESVGLQYYFLFAPVHAVSAAAWGIIPRLLRGRFGTDFFNDGRDNAQPYGYASLFWGFLWISFVSNALASATIAFLLTIYSGDLSCLEAAKSHSATTDPEMILCDAAKLLFSAEDYAFQGVFWKITTAKTLFGWPDHLIALSVAVLVVATMMPGRRYRMAGLFGLTLVTQRRQLAILFTAAFVAISLYRISYARHLGGDGAAFWDLLVLVVYTNLLLLLFLKSSYEFDAFEDDLDKNPKKYLFADVNTNLERAFEDGLKLITVLSVIIIGFFRLRCADSTCTATSSLFKDGGDRVTGFLGVVFVITFVRYLALIFARAGRAT